MGLRAAAAVVSLFVVVARVRAGIVIAARVAVVRSRYADPMTMFTGSQSDR